MGTYNLNNGLLTGGGTGGTGGLEVVGVTGSGYFNQSGGTNIVSSRLFVGGAAAVELSGGGPLAPLYHPGYGIYTLSGGLLSVPVPTGGWGEYVGDGGQGIFNQTGGSNMTVSISLGGASNGTSVTGFGSVQTNGTYNLNGGVLQTSEIQQYWTGAGSANFNFNAGTLQVGGGTLTNYMPVTVGTAASNLATVDANGQTAILNNYYSISGVWHPYRPGPIEGDRQRRRRRRYGCSRRHLLVRRQYR